MDVTRRCDYACRILRAAYRSGASFRSVSEIAEEEGIPYAFARSIQHDLVKGGLIKTVRGAHGGLALNCDPAEVTLLDLLEVIQGPVSVSACVLDPESCERREGCAYNKVWQGADRLLNAYFASITLEGLLCQGGAHPAVEQALAVPAPVSAGLRCSGTLQESGSAAACEGCSQPVAAKGAPKLRG